MLLSRTRLLLSVLASALILAVTPAWADAPGLLWSAGGGLAASDAVPRPVPQVQVPQSSGLGLDLTVHVPALMIESHKTKGGEYVSVSWSEAPQVGEIGAPSLPVIRRFFTAPLGTTVQWSVETGPVLTLDSAGAGRALLVQPVQPPIVKQPGEIENAPFVVDSNAYSLDGEFPTQRVLVEELGLARGTRLFLLTISPVAYNPVQQTLSYWPDLSINLRFAGAPLPPSAMSELPGVRDLLLNQDVLQAAPRGPRGSGNYLIIVAGALQSTITSFAGAKTAQGFSVSTWVPPSASTTVIKNYIQELWGGADAPDYLLLVGDTDTIPHWTGGGAGTPATDLNYVCMDGDSSTAWRTPDIAIGRFSVTTPATLQDVIDKVLLYENGPLPDEGYMTRAVFMASEDNYTVSEGTHNYVINTYMTPEGITSDKLYCHTYSATTQQVRDAFNAGRFYGIYSGHGGTTSWADGPPFSQSDVNGLTNGGMFSVVYSFACITGTYTSSECFMETWLRAANKGACAAVGSSVNSYWTEDDVLERRLFDVIYDGTYTGPQELGPVWDAARARYLAQMGTGSTTRRYFEMYNLMGDPSLSYSPTEATGLGTAPSGGLVAQGPVGGPFTPGSITYTLQNRNSTAINYSVTGSQPWISITNPSGTIPGGGSASVTVSINDQADALPTGSYSDTINIINTTDHDGDTTRPVALQVGAPSAVYSWNLSTNPGWTISGGQWAWGTPTGGGGEYGGPDPAAGHTGTTVYGYNLNGDYADDIPEYHLTTTAINCSNLAQVSLKFWRWLGVEQSDYDHAYVRVSNDGVNWTTIWENPASATEDSAWSQQSFDISALADGRATVYIRWTMGSTDGSWAYCGWNIDDVEIWGMESSAEDTTPPSPNPMAFILAPAPTGTTSISMTAATATDTGSPPVSYYFDFVSGGSGGDDSGWMALAGYVDVGLSANTAHTYRVKARDSAATPNETSYSPNAQTATHIETPTGVTFGSVTSSSIVLHAAGTFTNLTTGSSGLYFDSTTYGGDGGLNAWVQETTDAATGLTPNTPYTFRVKARNQNAAETAYGPTAAKYTLANTPAAPTLSGASSSTLNLEVNANGNPAATEFAVQCTAANPTDASWIGRYVSAAGAPGTTAVWQTDAVWGTITIIGLQPGTTYTFAVKARNGESIETAFGPGASLATLPLPTGACCDPATGACTIETPAACNAAGRVYQGDGVSCTPNPCVLPCLLLGDLNQDGVVDALDIAGFVRAKLGESPLPGENPACAGYGGDLNSDLAAFVADLLG